MVLEMKEKREFRKVGRYGNSIGVGIPKYIAEKTNITIGDELEVSVNEKNEIVLKKAISPHLPEGISPDVLKMVRDTMSKYKDTLEGLKDR